MKITRLKILIILITLVAANLACNFPGSTSASLPPTQLPMSTEEMQNLEKQIQATLESPNASGDVTVKLTQAQLNGIITSQLAQQPDQVIQDPSVVLTGGHAEMYGKVTQNGISANLKVVLQPEVDAAGSPKLHIVSINLGGVPVPDILKNRIASMTDNALSNYLDSNQNPFKVKNITITEGQMSITGTPAKP